MKQLLSLASVNAEKFTVVAEDTALITPETPGGGLQSHALHLAAISVIQHLIQPATKAQHILVAAGMPVHRHTSPRQQGVQHPQSQAKTQNDPPPLP